jgi:hypothetical protein
MEPIAEATASCRALRKARHSHRPILDRECRTEDVPREADRRAWDGAIS